jgi:hypothetical protein
MELNTPAAPEKNVAELETIIAPSTFISYELIYNKMGTRTNAVHRIITFTSTL